MHYYSPTLKAYPDEIVDHIVRQRMRARLKQFVRSFTRTIGQRQQLMLFRRHGRRMLWVIEAGGGRWAWAMTIRREGGDRIRWSDRTWPRLTAALVDLAEHLGIIRIVTEAPGHADPD